jgi:hypothetical protein
LGVGKQEGRYIPYKEATIKTKLFSSKTMETRRKKTFHDAERRKWLTYNSKHSRKVLQEWKEIFQFL